MVTKSTEQETAPVATQEAVTEQPATLPATTEQSTESTAEPEEAAAPVTGGIRSRRAFMLKQFVPSADWINVNIVAKGKGTQAVIGRIFGTVTGFADKVNQLPDGTPSESIVLNGQFESESYLDGEVSRASSVYLPMAYAEQIKTLFKTTPDIQVVEIDVDIGLEATGKTIPYTWVVIAHIEGEEMSVLKRIRNARQRPANAPALPASAAQSALPSA